MQTSHKLAFAGFGLMWALGAAPAPAPAPVCGNGVVEGDEQCDDGNTVSRDGCSATCTIEAVSALCEDGEVQVSVPCNDDDDQDDVFGGCGVICMRGTT